MGYMPLLKRYGPYVAKAAYRYMTKRPRKSKPPKNMKSIQKVRKGYRPKVGLKKMKRDLDQVRRMAKTDQGVHIGRYRATGVLTITNTAANYAERAFNRITEFESVISQLQYYDPTNPGTLLTASGATGTFQRKIMFKSTSIVVRIRNNYNYPVRLTVYFFQCTSDTDYSPDTLRSSGLTDLTTSSATTLLYPTDSELLNRYFKSVKSKKVLLQPGQEFIDSIGHKNISYDPSVSDTQDIEYQKKHKAGAIMIRGEGCLAHSDGTSTNVGNTGGQVDIEYRTTYTVEYPAGQRIKRIYAQDDASNLADPQICNRPQAVQINSSGI